MIVKMTKSTIKIAPNYILAILDQYAFEGKVRFPQYDVARQAYCIANYTRISTRR